MFEEYVIPYLRKLSDQVLLSVDIKLLDFEHASVEAVGEAPVAARLGSLLDNVNPTVATYIKDDGNLIRVTAKAKDEESAMKMIEPVVEKCIEAIGKQYVQSVKKEEKAWNM